uniref:Uncharacterized protein n=1 Tax=Eutreptiella gymnastica TaxID=73025 RepID=A0A7S1I5R9_9EUGL|mmetsp:Transcript_132184/g.229185  ORF Transcript_132184/g.229185 Transcript_132184/m.229185 type:complete len:668 (+) Transcript_132184:158-2161(+)
MLTTSALDKQAELWGSPILQDLVFGFWSTLPKSKNLLQEAVYRWIYHKAYWKVVQNGTWAECLRMADAEWLADRNKPLKPPGIEVLSHGEEPDSGCGDEGMQFAHFYDSVFTIIDIWCKDDTEDSYEAFARSLLKYLEREARICDIWKLNSDCVVLSDEDDAEWDMAVKQEDSDCSPDLKHRRTGTSTRQPSRGSPIPRAVRSCTPSPSPGSASSSIPHPSHTGGDLQARSVHSPQGSLQRPKERHASRSRSPLTRNRPRIVSGSAPPSSSSGALRDSLVSLRPPDIPGPDIIVEYVCGGDDGITAWGQEQVLIGTSAWTHPQSPPSFEVGTGMGRDGGSQAAVRPVPVHQAWRAKETDDAQGDAEDARASPGPRPQRVTSAPQPMLRGPGQGVSRSPSPGRVLELPGSGLQPTLTGDPAQRHPLGGRLSLSRPRSPAPISQRSPSLSPLQGPIKSPKQMIAHRCLSSGPDMDPGDGIPPLELGPSWCYPTIELEPERSRSPVGPALSGNLKVLGVQVHGHQPLSSRSSPGPSLGMGLPTSDVDQTRAPDLGPNGRRPGSRRTSNTSPNPNLNPRPDQAFPNAASPDPRGARPSTPSRSPVLRLSTRGTPSPMRDPSPSPARLQSRLQQLLEDNFRCLYAGLPSTAIAEAADKEPTACNSGIVDLDL